MYPNIMDYFVFICSFNLGSYCFAENLRYFSKAHSTIESDLPKFWREAGELPRGLMRGEVFFSGDLGARQTRVHIFLHVIFRQALTLSECEFPRLYKGNNCTYPVRCDWGWGLRYEQHCSALSTFLLQIRKPSSERWKDLQVHTLCKRRGRFFLL